MTAAVFVAFLIVLFFCVVGELSKLMVPRDHDAERERRMERREARRADTRHPHNVVHIRNGGER